MRLGEKQCTFVGEDMLFLLQVCDLVFELLDSLFFYLEHVDLFVVLGSYFFEFFS